MMRQILFSSAVALLAVASVYGQTANPPAGTNGAAPVSSAASAADLAKACKAEARYTPAYAYCNYIAAYYQGDSTAVVKLTQITQDAASLASAYSARRLASTVSSLGTTDQIVDKAAMTAPGNVLKKQAASPATGNGSTSLVAKSIATSLLGIAVESGALTESQSGNTITLQTNVDHLFEEAFTGTADLGYLPQGTPYLENFTVSASLAANSNSTISVPTTGSATSAPVNTQMVSLNSSATKLSSLTVNYEFNNPLTKSKLAKYKGPTIAISSDSTLTKTMGEAENALVLDFAVAALSPPAGCASTDYDNLKADFQKNPKGRPDPESFGPIVALFNRCFGQFATAAETGNTSIDAHLLTFTSAFQADIADFQSRLKKKLSGWDLSAQYVFNRPVGQPETHDFRLIGSGDLSKAVGTVWTVNSAFSLYGSTPTGAQYGRLKDAQFSGELDRSLGAASTSPSFSLAGYGQYQSKPSVLNITASSVPSGITLPPNAQVFIAGTQGWLGVVQAKLTLHLGGAQIPVAAKWSNKTDLLDKSKIGAQIGVSYDLSQLKQILGK
jgi:hypothetical protein